MLKQTPSLDSVSDSYQAYIEAAACDEYLFGDYDYCSEWLNDTEG